MAIPWPGACAASASPPDEFTFVRSFDQIVTTLGSRLQSLSQAQSQFAPAPRPALATCRNAPTKQYHNARLYVSDFFSSLSLYGLRRYGTYRHETTSLDSTLAVSLSRGPRIPHPAASPFLPRARSNALIDPYTSRGFGCGLERTSRPASRLQSSCSATTCSSKKCRSRPSL